MITGADGVHASNSPRFSSLRFGMRALLTLPDNPHTMAAEPPELDGIVDRLRPRAGLLVGTLAYVTGYAVTLALVVTVDSDYVSADLLANAGQLFHNAMFVDLQRPRGGASVNTLTNPQLSGVFTLPTAVYHLIPVVVFVAGGVALVRLLDAEEPLDAAGVGASLVFGTVFLALLVPLVFASDAGRPAFLPSVALVGVIYPGVCGAVGGVVASQFG